MSFKSCRRISKPAMSVFSYYPCLRPARVTYYEEHRKFRGEEKGNTLSFVLFCFVLSDYLVIQESLQGPGFVELGFYRGNTIDFLFDDLI